MSKILLPLHKKWSDMILDGQKPLEFRTKLPKDFGPGTTIYIYETKRNGSGGYVVGECKVKQIINVLNSKGKWPTYGCYPFIEYFYENIKHDEKTAQRIRDVKKEFEDKFERYKFGYILSFVFSDDDLQNIRENGEPIDTWKLFDMPQIRKILDDRNKAGDAIKKCDEWLIKIGFYNSMEESYYKFGIELTDITKYDTPKPLSDFTDKNGNPIIKAPQSFQYVY